MEGSGIFRFHIDIVWGRDIGRSAEDDGMNPMIGSILNLMGLDMMVILLIVLLLFGAKKLPELARGMGRAVKEFSAARDEIERGAGPVRRWRSCAAWLVRHKS